VNRVVAVAGIAAASGVAAASVLYVGNAVDVTRPPASIPGVAAQPTPTVKMLCTPGYSDSIRPPAAYTTTLKRSQIARWHLKGTIADYEEDHLLPLSMGGAPVDPKNLWPQPWPEAKRKDKAERSLHQLVCAKTITPARARRQILKDWGPKK
jgi:hypothetical protein